MTEATTTKPAAEPKEVVTVDGKSYEFGARDKVKKVSEILEDCSIVIKFVFRNGEVKQAVFEPTHSILLRAAQHGLDQKLGDELAGLKDVEDCVEAFEQMAERLQAGEWAAPSTGGNGMSGVSLLTAAIMRLSGKSKEAVRDQLKGLEPKVKSALAVNPTVAPVIAEIKAEREARARKPVAKIDTNELLGGLMAPAPGAVE